MLIAHAHTFAAAGCNRQSLFFFSFYCPVSSLNDRLCFLFRPQVTMMATCLKALAWSFLFCFVIMTVWAMLMVEIVHPVIQEIQQEKGVFDGCEQCVRSCQSVMDANLLLFKTVA